MIANIMIPWAELTQLIDSDRSLGLVEIFSRAGHSYNCRDNVAMYYSYYTILLVYVCGTPVYPEGKAAKGILDCLWIYYTHTN